MRVALLGLGIMGGGMAGCLLRAGHSLTVYNRTAAKAEPFVAMGTTCAATPAAAVDGAEVVISMVADDAASRAVWIGPEGALPAARPESVLLECSTLSMAWLRELADHAAARALPLLDCPVMGSKAAAQEGTLAIWAGGDPAALERARPVLAAISAEVIHLGPTGAGLTMKLIGNMIGAVTAAAFAEGIALAEAAGLSAETIMACLGKGAVASPFMQRRLPRMLNGDYADVHFELQWMRKDLSYATQMGESSGVPMPIAALAREMYQIACQRGFAELDSAAVIEAIRPRPHPDQEG